MKRIKISWTGAFMATALVLLVACRPFSAVIALFGAIVADWVSMGGPFEE